MHARALAACILIAATASCGSGPASASGAAAAPGPTCTDLDGVTHRPLAPSGARAHVLIFLGAECPIANAYAPEITAIVKDHAAAPVRFFAVHLDRGISAGAAREHARAFGLDLPVLLDPDRRLAAALGITVTPEAAVIGSGGAILYRGRIDDTFADLGVRRAAPAKKDLREAIDAVLAGRPVPDPRTEAIGCLVE